MPSSNSTSTAVCGGPGDERPGAPDGSLLISSMMRRCVLRFDGSDLTLHADLSSLAPYAINDMCVDRHGHAFVGQFGYDLGGGAPPATAALLLVDPDGSASVTCQPTPPGEEEEEGTPCRFSPSATSWPRADLRLFRCLITVCGTFVSRNAVPV
jgi:SMP-30/gluconolaconase/LRE-like protein